MCLPKDSPTPPATTLTHPIEDRSHTPGMRRLRITGLVIGLVGLLLLLGFVLYTGWISVYVGLVALQSRDWAGAAIWMGSTFLVGAAIGVALVRVIRRLWQAL
jgi:hypothetical protein